MKKLVSDAVIATLAERLRVIRSTRGLTQDEVAKGAGLARGNYGNVERGQRGNLRLATLEELARVLDVDVLDLFTDRPVDQWGAVDGDVEARFIANLKQLRSKSGLSQEKLAEAAGRFRTHVWRLENRISSPLVADLQDLAAALTATIPDLLQPLDLSGEGAGG